MARIRSIKPEFFTSEQVVECSPNARLLFVGLWCFCDDGGVHPASAKRAKMEVFPADDFSEADVCAMVDELISAGLLAKFEADGKTFWNVTGWHHQRIDKPTYKFPSPPTGQNSDNVPRGLAEHSTNGCRTVGDRSPPEWSGEDGIGRELKTTAPSAPCTDVAREPCREAAVAAVAKAGVSKCGECVDRAIADGMPLQQIIALAEYARTFGDRWGAGAIFRRIADHGMKHHAVDAGWPPDSAKYAKRAAEQQRKESQSAEPKRKPAISDEAKEAAEATLKTLTESELLKLFSKFPHRDRVRMEKLGTDVLTSPIERKLLVDAIAMSGEHLASPP